MQLYTDRNGIQQLLTEGSLSIDSDTGEPVFPIIWDTDVNGPFLDEWKDLLGGLKRVEVEVESELQDEEGNTIPAVMGWTLQFDQETKDIDDAAKAAIEPTYAEKRRDEYMKIPEWEWREAVYEAAIGDFTKMDAYDAKIQSIKQQFPKG